MIFKTPMMLFLLLLLPILWKILSRARRLQNQAAETLRGEKKQSTGWKWKTALHLGSFAALILALAQPAWNPHSGSLTAQGRDVVIALDISRSMLANDVFPTRLDAARIAIYESLDAFRGQRIGLITFAGAASVRVPLTLDHHFVRYMLEHAAPSDANIGSTALQSAIEKAIDVVLPESEKGEQDLILFTDGEDHLSDSEATAEMLRECGAQVLIIGLGDPIAGAKIPGMSQTNEWMQFNGEDVITRLDEDKLIQLSTESPNVTYYAARTRPFDLVDLYRQMIADTNGLPVSDETLLVYTEGYPYFIAAALLLWIIPLSKRLFPVAALLLIAGCAPEPSFDPIQSRQSLEANYHEHIEQACTLWTEAQDSTETDPGMALVLLYETREIFLQAARIQPGDVSSAQKISGVTAQIHAVEQKVKEQEAAEKDLQQKLQEAIEQLSLLTQRETELSRQSKKLLQKRPSIPWEEKAAAAPPAREEQTGVAEGTSEVLSTVTEIQTVIQEMMRIAYGETEDAPLTEFDQAAVKLASARQSQQTTIKHLNPDAINWPQANSAIHAAARQMQAALQLLSDQNQGQDSQESSEPSDESEMDWDFEEEMDWSESDQPSDMSMPMQSGNFKTALESRSLPTPNYTAEEILMEEAANMKQRAQQQSDRAGSKVEKNW